MNVVFGDDGKYHEEFDTFEAVPHPDIPPMAYCQDRLGF